MTDLYLARQVRELDRIAIQEKAIPGIVLMKRAAEASVKVIEQRWLDGESVGVLCGAGNNAADGYIIAGLLKNRGWSVCVARLGERPMADTDAGAAYQFMLDAGIAESSLEVVMASSNVFVDALLGTGLNRPVADHYAAAIQGVNETGLPVLSVDLPSGLSADTGAVMGLAIRASDTVTFIGRKVGLYTNDGPEFTGRVHFDDLDVPDDIYQREAAVASLLDLDELRRVQKPRHQNSHKVDHGRLLIIGGDQGMAGAVTMSAEAAMYCGAGTVTVGTHQDNRGVVVSRRPEVMATGISVIGDIETLIARADVIVMGPGLGRSQWSRMVFDTVIKSRKPLVLDADGLNLLATHADGRHKEGGDDTPLILTPHPGEASRLLGFNSAEVQSDRIKSVKALQSYYGGVALIKGAGTVITDGQVVRVCPYGNPGMAVAGMGDVLSGVVGALLANGLSPYDATCFGVALHSLAADRLVARQGEIGLMATELLPEIRVLLNRRD